LDAFLKHELINWKKKEKWLYVSHSSISETRLFMTVSLEIWRLTSSGRLRVGHFRHIFDFPHAFLATDLSGTLTGLGRFLRLPALGISLLELCGKLAIVGVVSIGTSSVLKRFSSKRILISSWGSGGDRDSGWSHRGGSRGGGRGGGGGSAPRSERGRVCSLE
jgi:uncharacterized membrane protein YgcG